MQLAYSLLLSEYIAASELDYEDYRRFLVVCPACYEPLFKVVRSAKNDSLNTQHFYSHYARDKAYNEECELRCAKITESHIEKTAAFSRGQKLALFLSVINEQIALAYHSSDPEHTRLEKSQKFVHAMLQSKALTDYLNEFFLYLRSLKHDLLVTNINLTFDSYLKQLADSNKKFEDYPTTFSLQVQKRIATDILKHLLTIKGRPSFNFVFCHAYQMVLFNIELTRKQIPLGDGLLKIYQVMNRLPETGRKQGLRLQQELKANSISWPENISPTLLEQTKNLWEEMSIRILINMVAAILRLPYYELLQTAYTQNEGNRTGPIRPL